MTMPGDKWLSGPGVPQGEMGVQPKYRLVMTEVEVDEDAEPRHVDFSDPPYGVTSERYEEMLREAAAAAPSAEDLAAALFRPIAGDMVISHHVDPRKAIEAVIRFAERLYGEAHP